MAEKKCEPVAFHKFVGQFEKGDHDQEMIELGVDPDDAQKIMLAVRDQWAHVPESKDKKPHFHQVARMILNGEFNDQVDGKRFGRNDAKLVMVFALQHCVVPRGGIADVRDAINRFRRDQTIHTACMTALPEPVVEVNDA